MKPKFMKWSALLMAAFLIAGMAVGCGSETTSTSTTTAGTAATGTTSASAASAVTSKAEYSSEDMETGWDSATATAIVLEGNNASVTGSGAVFEDGVVRITAAGTYVFSGTLDDGQILVDAGEKDTVRLVLNGVQLRCSDSAAIYSAKSEKTIITLAENTVNSVEDGASYTYAEGEDEPDASIFSKSDLTINGSGSLTVKGNFNNGIGTKDDLVITGGSITLTAAKDGLRGRDSIAIRNGTFDITVTGDAVDSNNDEDETKGWVVIDGGKFKISAGDDAIHAESDLIVNAGEIDITTCTEGLEGVTVTVNGGTIGLKASDDGLNAAGGVNSVDQSEKYVIQINGGTLTVDADGDGLDSNGSLYFAGGSVFVSGPTNNGNGPMDYNYNCEVTGGTLAIAGSSGMAQSPQDSSTQASITVYYTSVQKAGTQASLVDESGNTVFSFTPAKDYQSILISIPGLATGKTYTLKAGDTKLTDMTLSSVVTRISDDGSAVTAGMGGPGGGKGGPGGRPDGAQPPTGGTPPEAGGQMGGKRGTPPTDTTAGTAGTSNTNVSQTQATASGSQSAS